MGFTVVMKNVLVSGIAVFLLTGCGGDDATDKSGDLTVQHYSGGTFSIDVPRDWEVIERNNMPSSVPPETAVAFRNNVKNPFFIASLTVSQFAMSRPLSNADFAAFMIQKHKDTVHDFAELAREPVTLRVSGEDSETMIFSFQGRDGFDGDITVFREAYLFSGDLAYVVTAAHGQSEDAGTVIQLENALESFQLL